MNTCSSQHSPISRSILRTDCTEHIYTRRSRRSSPDRGVAEGSHTTGLGGVRLGLMLCSLMLRRLGRMLCSLVGVRCLLPRLPSSFPNTVKISSPYLAQFSIVRCRRSRRTSASTSDSCWACLCCHVSGSGASGPSCFRLSSHVMVPTCLMRNQCSSRTRWHRSHVLCDQNLFKVIFIIGIFI